MVESSDPSVDGVPRVTTGLFDPFVMVTQALRKPKASLEELLHDLQNERCIERVVMERLERRPVPLQVILRDVERVYDRRKTPTRTGLENAEDDLTAVAVRVNAVDLLER